MKKFTLNFACGKNVIGVAIDQEIFGSPNIISLISYYYWHSVDTWEHSKSFLDNVNFMPKSESFELMNKVTEVINVWQDREVGAPVDMKKLEQHFPTCIFCVLLMIFSGEPKVMQGSLNHNPFNRRNNHAEAVYMHKQKRPQAALCLSGPLEIDSAVALMPLMILAGSSFYVLLSEYQKRNQSLCLKQNSINSASSDILLGSGQPSILENFDTFIPDSSRDHEPIEEGEFFKRSRPKISLVKQKFKNYASKLRIHLSSPTGKKRLLLTGLGLLVVGGVLIATHNYPSAPGFFIEEGSKYVKSKAFYSAWKKLKDKTCKLAKKCFSLKGFLLFIIVVGGVEYIVIKFHSNTKPNVSVPPVSPISESDFFCAQLKGNFLHEKVEELRAVFLKICEIENEVLPPNWPPIELLKKYGILTEDGELRGFVCDCSLKMSGRGYANPSACPIAI